MKQGGSRRGLPQSFLNRFTQVYINSLNENDYECILMNQFPDISEDLIHKMIEFNNRVNEELMRHTFGHRGGPWEFNLRDLTRWCEVLTFQHKTTGLYQPEGSIGLIYADRMRCMDDKEYVRTVFKEIFKVDHSGDNPIPFIIDEFIYMGDVRIKRETNSCNVNMIKQDKTCLLLRGQFNVLRSLIYNVNLKWMSILVSVFILFFMNLLQKL